MTGVNTRGCLTRQAPCATLVVKAPRPHSFARFAIINAPSVRDLRCFGEPAPGSRPPDRT